MCTNFSPSGWGEGRFEKANNVLKSTAILSPTATRRCPLTCYLAEFIITTELYQIAAR